MNCGGNSLAGNSKKRCSPMELKNLVSEARLPKAFDVETARIDREQAYLLFATFCGNPERTAHALGISPAAVVAMSEHEGWKEKLKPIIDLHSNAQQPADIERAINRALNFVQAHRLRLTVERALRRLFLAGDDSGEALENLLTDWKVEKDGTKIGKFSARALADLAAAMEKAQVLSYMALSDSAVERTKRKDDTPALSASALHVQIAEAMSRALSDAAPSPRAELFDAQLADAEDRAREARTT
jgi:hypothetical protein